MRAYADTSFLVKLVSTEPGSDRAAAEYRRHRLPRLFYLPLHALEVENAIRQHIFHQRRSVASSRRVQMYRERDAALSRVRRLMERGQFLQIAIDWDEAVSAAVLLSRKYTESFGTRSFDLLHISCALDLDCELFFTTDQVQARAAAGAGLRVVSSVDPD